MPSYIESIVMEAIGNTWLYESYRNESNRGFPILQKSTINIKPVVDYCSISARSICSRISNRNSQYLAIEVQVYSFNI